MAIEAKLNADLALLRDASGVADVRVLGSVGAVEMRDAFDVDRLRAWFIDRGVFIRPLGRVIYIAPAYTIPMEDLSKLTAEIQSAVRALPV